MISQQSIEKFTKKYQTIKENVVREYCQHMFLSCFYRLSGSERVLFKGGTALRLIYGSPRFSEDLDFSGFGIKVKEVEDIFANVLSEIEKTNIGVDIKEAKTTTGGYLGRALFRIFDMEIEIKIDVSLRNGSKTKGTSVLIKSEIFPSYIVLHVPQEMLIQGKIQALFARSKARDFFDFYFILRHPDLHRCTDAQSLQKAKDSLQKSDVSFKRELSLLLPVSHHLLLKDFRTVLAREIDRNL